MFLKEYKIDYSSNELIISIEIPEMLDYNDNDLLEDVYIDLVALQHYSKYTINFPENPDLLIQDSSGFNQKIKTLDIKIELSKLFDNNINPYEPLYVYLKVKGDNSILKTNLFVYCNIDWNIFYNYSIKLYYNLIKNNYDHQSREELLDIYFKKSLLQSAIEYKEFQTVNNLWDDIIKNEFIKNLCLNKYNNIKL